MVSLYYIIFAFNEVQMALEPIDTFPSLAWHALENREKVIPTLGKSFLLCNLVIMVEEEASNSQYTLYHY